MTAVQAHFKRILSMSGARVPKRLLLDAHVSLNYMRLGRWMRDHRFSTDTRVASRERCFDLVAEEVGHLPVLYLEFGVHMGASLRYWARVLDHPETRLMGFDSFEGLPQTFDERNKVDRSMFDLGGVAPRFDDPRIDVRKGWFEDVLPYFTPPQHDQLILGLDADLYSSTICVLRHLDAWIVPGAFLYFDDLAHVGHETLAFDEYMEDTGKRFELFAAEWTLNRCVFRRV